MYFEKFYDWDNENTAESCVGVVNDCDNSGWYFTGRLLYWSTNLSSAILSKINNLGDTLSVIKISNENMSYAPTGLVRLNDCNIILASTATNAFTNKSDYSIIKINVNNEVEFSKIYGDSINNDRALHIISTNDNGFLIVGQSVVPPLVSADMYVVKTDSAGNFEWEKYYGGNYFEGCYSAIQTPDTGYLILGWTKSFGNGGTDWYLVKTDKYGNQQWQKTYGSSSGDTGLDIISLSDGNYLLTGTTGGSGFSNGVLRKVDAAGTVIWIKSYAHESNPKNNTRKTIELSDGSLVSAGMTHITDDAGWLIKTDHLGNQLWSRMYNKNTSIDLFYDMIPTADGGFLMAGLAWNPENSSQDAWLLKVDSVGCAYENCLVGIDEAGSKKILVDVYPNPTSEVLNIELQEAMQNAELRIENLNGQMVYKSPIVNPKSQINVSGFANGIYLLTMESAEFRTILKIVIQH